MTDRPHITEVQIANSRNGGYVLSVNGPVALRGDISDVLRKQWQRHYGSWLPRIEIRAINQIFIMIDVVEFLAFLQSGGAWKYQPAEPPIFGLADELKRFLDWRLG